jgi:hypothetical protein
MRKRGRVKARQAKEGKVYGPHHQHVKALARCVMAGIAGHVCGGEWDSHHVKTVGSGGKDAGNVVPMCRDAHREVHALAPSKWEAKYPGVDLKALAEIEWRVSPHNGEG